MSDANKFINTYVDTMMATLHEYLGSSLQLKTQLKLVNEQVTEKDSIISSITSELERVKAEFLSKNENDVSLKSELISYQDRVKALEETNASLGSKVSHMDTLTNQMTGMKNEIRAFNDIVARKDADIASFSELNSQLSQRIQTLEDDIKILSVSVLEKDDVIKSLTKKLDAAKEKTAVTTIRPAKELSSVKNQLNSKAKQKETPVDDDF